MLGGLIMFFFNGLDELSMVVMLQFGIVVVFVIDNMICFCDGYNLNSQQFLKVQVNYDCFIINV